MAKTVEHIIILILTFKQVTVLPLLIIIRYEILEYIFQLVITSMRAILRFMGGNK